MEKSRFDDLVRLFGTGASRRTMVRGLLGLGVTGLTGRLAGQHADARSIGTRPTIPPPPLPAPTTTTTTPSTTTTPDPCTGFRCGLECCDSMFQCCDRECCAAGYECLSRHFAEDLGIEEEVCCLAGLICDGQCCSGECFDPNPLSPLPQTGKSCCPDSGTVCAGLHAFADTQLCCDGATPDCCVREDGQPVCIDAESQCCRDAECPPDPANCLDGICTRESQSCGFEVSINCDAGQRCCTGGDNVCCATGQECCGSGQATTCCASGYECCGTTCIDPQVQCCTDADCLAAPFGFDTECIGCDLASHRCVFRNQTGDCNNDECSICLNGFCVESDAQCAAPDACTPADCAAGVCNQQSVCPDTAPNCCGTGVQDCVDLQSDEFNCGSCDNPCEDGFVCVLGQCVCDDDGDCPVVDPCTPGACNAGACQTTSSCPDGEICCGAGGDAGCCSAAECIAGSCCTGEGETICMDSAGAPSCAPGGASCCGSNEECAALNGCGGPEEMLHRTFTCGDGGFCVVLDQEDCNDDNVCTIDFCDNASGCSHSAVICPGSANPCLSPVCTPPSFGCGFSAASDGALVAGGVCCNSGSFIQGGNCCGDSICSFIDNCTSDICDNNQCPAQTACSSPPNPQCQTSVCTAAGTCSINTNCAGNPSVGVGQQCSFGCQCPSNAVCSSDAPSDPATCRTGGGGNSVRNFCPVA